MLKSSLVLLVLFSSASVLAASRASTTNMTCSQAKSYVDARGAVVLGTGAGTYERIVSDGSRCELDEGTIPMWVQTRDSSACFVGYTCEMRERN